MLGIVGCCWVLMGVVGCCWVLLGINGCRWASLGVDGCHLVSLGVVGHRWGVIRCEVTCSRADGAGIGRCNAMGHSTKYVAQNVVGHRWTAMATAPNQNGARQTVHQSGIGCYRYLQKSSHGQPYRGVATLTQPTALSPQPTLCQAMGSH